MIGIFNSITINGVQVFRPNEMQITREDVYAGAVFVVWRNL